MPIITVAGPDHVQIRVLMQRIADACAAALGLGSGDVIATHVRTGSSARSGGAPAALWLLISIHGSERDGAMMEAARDAAAHAAGVWCETFQVELEGVWVQWQLPMPR